VNRSESLGKLLIIHPDDRSTDVLRVIYEDIPADKKTVITGGIDSFELDELIASHDRVMMLGHGFHEGLLSMGQFDSGELCIINRRHVPLLRDNPGNIYIWCYASSFVEKYALKGFASGMFVSEVAEAAYVGLADPLPTQEEVDISADTFSRIVAKHVMSGLSPEALHKAVVEEYGILASTSRVAKYNVDLLRAFP